MAPNTVRQPIQGPQPNPGSASGQYWQEALHQLGAAGSGADDALTFGLGDHVVAGTRALFDKGGLDGWSQRYQANMAKEKAQDQYDAAHYGAARTTGQVAGTVAQLAALGPLDGAVAGGVRMAEAAPMIAREAAAIGGGGGALGVGGQALSDIHSGHIGSAGDYAAAGAGGAVNALASVRMGPGKGGAIGGATTSVLRDLLNLRPVSLSDASHEAVADGWTGGAAGVGGRALSDNLSIASKGRLGEDMSRLRTWAQGDSTIPGKKVGVRLANGKLTIPDSRTVSGKIVESKMGRSARLSTNQRAAYNQPLTGYRVDHWLPQDFGALSGALAGLLQLRHAGNRDF